jgi:lipopolysaccharide export system protein LptA
MRSRRWPSLVFLVVAAGPAWALSTDIERPINIEADHATLDDASRRVTYEGSVVVNQGTMRILADRLDLYYNAQRKLDKAVAVGNPARYRQLPDGSQQYVNAHSRTMEYFTDTNLLHLIGEAEVVQGADRVTGDRIIYDTVKHRAQAQAAESGKQRVTVTIRPNRPQGGEPARDP